MDELHMPEPQTRLETFLAGIYNKVSGGSVSEEQIKQAVKEYLDEHPEIVTTVPDGSITTDKLSDEVITDIQSEILSPLSNEEIDSMLNDIF